MSDPNQNFFYDSDEDVAWGPRTLREIKRDLKRGKILPPNYRRQTNCFIPYTAENNSEMCTIANSSHSSKDYFTANESIESNNIQSSADIPEDVPKSVIPDSSNEYPSIMNKANQSELSEVIALSSDSEYEDEKFSCSQNTKYNSFSSGKEASNNNIICLSSSDDEESLPGNDEKELYVQIHDLSADSIEDEQTPKCKIKSDVRDMSNDEMAWNNETEKQLSCSSNNFYYRDDFLTEDDKLISPMVERQCAKIKIISNTPIRGPNVSSKNDSDHQNSVEDDQSSKQIDIFNESEDRIDIANNSSENVNSCESSSSNAQDTSNNGNPHVSSNISLYKLNLSQNENEYDYCEEINHTLSSKIQLDLSLKNSNESENSNEAYCTGYGSVTESKKSDLSGIHSLPSNSSDNKYDSLNLNESIQNESTNSKIDNMHDESMSDSNANPCLNDTFAEMERLLTQGFDSDSEDSSEEIIDSTSCNNFRPAFGNSSIQNISRIPVPKSFSDDSKSNSSISNEFKIPKLPAKAIKKTPVNNKLAATRTSPLLLKNIVSPVRLYINNSPVAALKQNNKPACTKSQNTLYGISESTVCVPKKRRNLLDSLPEKVYKPSKLVREKCDNQIILPNNIRKLITERIVIKHDLRRRINPDESMYSVQDKLAMRDLSVIVSDEQNMSVHTTKQGFHL